MPPPQPHKLILWDIDRTLLYTGEIDRHVYREIFAELIGRPAESLPERGTGVTMPRAARDLLASNGIPNDQADAILPKFLKLLPAKLAEHAEEIRRDGIVLPGAINALKAVQDQESTVSTVVTGNLKPNAIIKLSVLGLAQYLETEVGAYASDDEHRPNLVAIAQARARRQHAAVFTQANTLIIGDSLQDVITGRQGGASVIAVASGTTSHRRLHEAGADIVLNDLIDIAAVLDAIATATARGTHG